MRWLILFVVAAIALCACGTTDDRADIQTVVDRFSSAVADSDGDEACRQLSDALVEAVESDNGERCAEAVTESEPDSGQISAIHVFITSAAVRQGADMVFLDRESDDWKITAFGCRPKPERSRDAPLHCEEEA